jgi:hypothetical protein
VILLTPGLRAVGLEESDGQWRAALARRSGEPWYPGALAALKKAEAGDESADNRRGYMPFFYGHWDDAARAHVEVGVSERSRPVRDGFAAVGAFHPAATREHAGQLAAPVLVHAGELHAVARPRPPHQPRRCSPTPRSPSCPAPRTSRGWMIRLFTTAITAFLT